MYAMEISVEKDPCTGNSQVLSSAIVSPQKFQQKGIKVYDDGQKSVYALRLAGKECEGALDQLSPLEVEELLRKATVKKNPNDVEYHEPVFSSSYSMSSTPQKVEQGIVSSGSNGLLIQSNTSSPLQPDNQTSQHQEDANPMRFHAPDQVDFQMSKHAIKGQKPNITKGGNAVHTCKSELMQVLIKEKNLIPVAKSHLGFERSYSFYPKEDTCFCLEDSITSEIDCSESVTMIFMGYQNAEADEENDTIQAEMVVIGNDEEDDEEEPLSYHPQGYHSKVFQPTNDNLYRSEVNHGFIKNHSSGGYLPKYGTQNT